MYPLSSCPKANQIESLYHLSRPTVASWLYLPTPHDTVTRRLAPMKGRHGVHGISTHKVCPPHLLLNDAVRSYRTFSPLPFSLLKIRRLFSVTLAVFRLHETPSVRWCGARCCSDFPRPSEKERDRAVSSFIF